MPPEKQYEKNVTYNIKNINIGLDSGKLDEENKTSATLSHAGKVLESEGRANYKLFYERFAYVIVALGLLDIHLFEFFIDWYTRSAFLFLEALLLFTLAVLWDMTIVLKFFRLSAYLSTKIKGFF